MNLENINTLGQWIFILLGQVFTAGAIYGALRSDIKHLIDRSNRCEENAGAAHQRIDTLLLHGGNGKSDRSDR